MRGNWNHYGYPMGRHGWHGGYYRRGGFMWVLPMLMLFFLMMGVFRFFWPLLLIGLIFLIVKGMAFKSRRWDGGDWGDKFKNDEKRKHDEYDDGEKPKRDEADGRRYVQTEDGEWLEII